MAGKRDRRGPIGGWRRGAAIAIATAVCLGAAACGGGSVSVETGSAGRPIKIGTDWTYEVTDVWTAHRIDSGSRGASGYSMEYPAIANGEFVVVELRAAWHGGFGLERSAQPVVLLGGDGKLYAEDKTVSRDMDHPFHAGAFNPNGRSGGWGKDIAIGNGKSMSGVLVFDVPRKAAHGSKLEVEPEHGKLLRIGLGL